MLTATINYNTFSKHELLKLQVIHF